MIKILKAIDINELTNLFLLTRRNTFKLRASESFQIVDYAKSVEEDNIWIAEENNISLDLSQFIFKITSFTIYSFILIIKTKELEANC
jgi:hypothetical protein